MKTAIILEEHISLFAELDPFGFLDRAYFPDRVCLGTVVEGKDGGNDIPAGLMILHMMDKMVIVEWIYVRPELRMHGIGSSLMAHAFKSAEAAGYDRLYLSRDMLPDRDKVCLYEEDFFSEYNFEDEKGFSGEWIKSVSDMLKHPVLGKNADRHKKTYSLNELSDLKLLELKEYVMDKDGDFFLYEPAFTDEFADKDISRVLIEKDRITGVILIQDGGDELYITGLFSENRMDNVALCHGALMAIEAKYGKEKAVHVLKYRNTDLDLVTGLLGDEHLGGSILSASVSDYYDAVDSFEPYEGFYNICSVLSKGE